MIIGKGDRMPRERPAVRAWGVVLSVGLLTACSPTAKESEDPGPLNLLFILTDQQARDTLGAYGNDKIRTPNLDTLAREGVVFETAYVSQPVCSPARATLMTGLYPHTHGVITNNIPLSRETPTLVEMLPESYETAWYGKWHLGDEIFRQRGFDDYESTEDNYARGYADGRDREARSGYHHFLLAAGIELEGGGRFGRRFANTLSKELSKPAYVAGKGAEFLEQHGDEPFVLYLSFLDPHTPFNSVNDDLYDPADMDVPATFHEELDPTVLERKREIRELLQRGEAGSYGRIIDTPADLQAVKARYWGKVTLVDEMVGRVLTRLRELGLAERTIVVFTSEHGELMGAHRMMFKSVSYDEAATVPLLLRIPGASGGHRVAGPVSQVDLVPTLLDLMGQPRPGHLEGESWAQDLRAGRDPASAPVFFEFNGPPWPYEDRFTERLRSVVSPDGWKLTLDDESHGELYDLGSDPEERRNLFYEDTHLERVQSLVAAIRRWQERTGDDPIRFDEDAWRRHRERLR